MYVAIGVKALWLSRWCCSCDVSGQQPAVPYLRLCIPIGQNHCGTAYVRSGIETSKVWLPVHADIAVGSDVPSLASNRRHDGRRVLVSLPRRRARTQRRLRSLPLPRGRWGPRECIL